jgi:hypothetical protein
VPAFFRATVAGFLATTTAQGLDQLTAGLAAQGFDLTPDQRAAWVEEWARLQTALQSLSDVQPSVLTWALLLEYPIPGRQKRIDAVLLTPNGMIVIEFKSGREASSAARWQAREYCWNLRDFHRESRHVPMAPVLCIVEFAQSIEAESLEFSDRHQLVLDLQICNPVGLAPALARAFERLRAHPDWQFHLERWDSSPVQPTPSVIEFAQQIFGGHDVREISHATADNTDAALDRVRMAFVEARRDQKRIICFVTGVPGAGKTLVGLNVAYRLEMVATAGGPVCFASGNKPLLDVLKTALVRNRSRNSRRRREVGHDLTAPVQDVHEYVRVTLSAEEVQSPPFQAIVFDEAQRVWDAEKLLDGLNTRKRRRQLNQEQIDCILRHGSSEPELLLSLMERCPNWCVVVALVGGGQEIHNGEAGLGAWGKALAGRNLNWIVWASNDALEGGVSNAGQRLFTDITPDGVEVIRHDDLHLSVSKRCFRAERYAEWVNHVVSGNAEAARELATELSEFPVFVARDLTKARELIRRHADAGLRCGLLASSGAVRLRADGIEVSQEFRGGIKFPDWFLRPTGDIRSSSQLEVAATEFECQGLELDWCCVCWGNDFVVAPTGGWQFQRLRAPGGAAPRWNSEEDVGVREFVRNKYRVLLTRARVGVVIFIPRGSNLDSTHSPENFDATAEYFGRCGAVLCGASTPQQNVPE